MEADGPSSRTIHFAQVQAIERPDGAFFGGPVLGDDPESIRLRHTRREVPVDSFKADFPDAPTLAGSFAYLGIAFAHFGHTMAETIHRIVPTRRIVRDPQWLILGQKDAPPTFAGLPQVCRAVLRLFDIDERNCTVVTQDTLVETLLVVEAGSDIGGGPKDWYLRMLRHRGPARMLPSDGYPKRIYVSRSGLAHRSGLLGEQVLEQMLAEAGFHILRAEALPLAEQIAHYANAEVLLFAEGSACHGVEVFGRRTLGHSILMNRRNKRRSHFEPVLAPRSRRFDTFFGNPYLGSVLVNPHGVPLVNRGVAAIALHELATVLTDLGIANVRAPSPLAYLAAAHHDLERYLALAATEAQAMDPSLADGLRAALAGAVQAGGSIAPMRRPVLARADRPPQNRAARERRKATEEGA